MKMFGENTAYLIQIYLGCLAYLALNTLISFPSMLMISLAVFYLMVTPEAVEKSKNFVQLMRNLYASTARAYQRTVDAANSTANFGQSVSQFLAGCLSAFTSLFATAPQSGKPQSTPQPSTKTLLSQCPDALTPLQIHCLMNGIVGVGALPPSMVHEKLKTIESSDGGKSGEVILEEFIAPYRGHCERSKEKNTEKKISSIKNIHHAVALYGPPLP